MKKKRINIKKEYKESWKYIKKSKNFILGISLIFLFFVLIGSFIPTPEPLRQEILKFIQKIIEKTKDLSGIRLITFIFLNNLQASLSGLILGVLLGIIPIFLAGLNGYILGFVFSLNKNIIDAFRILPYGIFELPAVFISLGLGAKIGFSIFQKKSELKKDLINSLKVFALIVIPLLIIAAIIEGILINYS